MRAVARPTKAPWVPGAPFCVGSKSFVACELYLECYGQICCNFKYDIHKLILIKVEIPGKAMLKFSLSLSKSFKEALL